MAPSLIDQVLEKISDVKEWHEKDILNKIGDVSWKNSIINLHGKNQNNLSTKYYRRLAYDEILANLLVLSQVRKRIKKLKLITIKLISRFKQIFRFHIITINFIF